MRSIIAQTAGCMRSTGNLDAPLAAISSGELTLGGWIYHNGAVVDVDIITSGAATLTWHSEGDIGLQDLSGPPNELLLNYRWDQNGLQGKWVHCVVSMADGGNAILYIQGTAVTTTSMGVSGVETGINITLGNADSTAALFSECFIANRVYTADEIATAYQASKYPDDGSLQGLWLLDDVEAAAYGQDSSGNGRHATLKSGIIAYPDSPRRHRAIRPARVGLRIKTNAASNASLGASSALYTAVQGQPIITVAADLLLERTPTAGFPGVVSFRNVANAARLGIWSDTTSGLIYGMAHSQEADSEQAALPDAKGVTMAPRSRTLVGVTADFAAATKYVESWMHGTLLDRNASPTFGQATYQSQDGGFKVGHHASGALPCIYYGCWVWTRALTKTEWFYLAQGIVPRDSLVAEWLFDEGTGSTVVDRTGNGNDLTVTNADWILNYEDTFTVGAGWSRTIVTS